MTAYDNRAVIKLLTVDADWSIEAECRLFHRRSKLGDQLPIPM